MARQCTQPKRPRNDAWYKEKAMLAEAQEAGQILDEEQLAFLADPGILADQAQIIIPHNATVQDTNLQAQQDSMIFLTLLGEERGTTPNALEEERKFFGTDRPLTKIMSQDVLLTVINSMSWNNDSVNMEMQTCDSCEKCLNLDAELSKSKQAYNDLLKNYSQLEKHCISLEVSMQLKQEVFQNDESCVNHNGVEIQEYFEINDLKARLQDKDTTICKLKDTIRSLSKNTKEENVNHDKCELEPINEELENSVAKLLSENERLWKENLFKNVVHIPSATTIAPGMFKLDLEPLPPRLLQNREVHIDDLRNTQEQANILRKIVEQAKAKQPLDSELDLACNIKKVTVKPMNNVKKVRFAEPLTSSSNSKQVESSNTSDSNTPVLSSTGVKCSTRNCRSKPPGNKKNDRISQTPSRNKKNKVEAQPRKVNNSNRVVKPVCDVDVKHSLSNTNSEILCATCNKSMFDGVHDKCLLDLVQNGNKRTKSAKKHKKQNIWKPTGHVFTEVGFKWKPTGRTFTIVGNSCPLTRLSRLYSVRFRNDQIARIMGYGDYQLGNVGISRVYYVEGLGHNLFSVGQFCDADLEVAF
ncbi:hypothetical protein Tco_0630746 [Tanacetum coccineum]